MGIEATARGQGYYNVFVNGAFFSRHLQEREALEKCMDILLTDQTVQVHYSHAYDVDVYFDTATEQLPDPPPDQPQTDSGMDLVDFLTQLDEQAHGPLVYGERAEGVTFMEQVQNTVIAHRDSGSWLFKRLVQDQDGDFTTTADGVRIGLTWRGYLLLWLWRDPNAIRIGTGGNQ